MEHVRSAAQNLRRFGWMILVVAVVAGGTAALADGLRAPVYRASARVALRPAPALTDQRVMASAVAALDDRTIAGTFARMFTAPAQRDAAQQAAGLSPAAAAAYQLAADLQPDAPVIEVSVSGPDPGAAQNYLNAALNVTVANTRTLFGVVDLLPLEPAQPAVVVTPRPARDVPLAAGLGALCGLLLALAVPYLLQAPQRPAGQQTARAGRRARPWLRAGAPDG